MEKQIAYYFVSGWGIPINLLDEYEKKYGKYYPNYATRTMLKIITGKNYDNK